MSRGPFRQPSPMPGFGPAMGITVAMLSIVVLLPIGALLLKGADYGAAGIWATVNRERVWRALWLSFRLSFLAALFNLVFGVVLAWVLSRYRFPGRRLLDAAVRSYKKWCAMASTLNPFRASLLPVQPLAVLPSR